MPYSAALSTNISTNFWPAALQGGEETDLAFLGLLVATSSWLVQTPQCLLFPLFLSRFATNLLMLMMPSQCFYPGIISGSLLLPRDRPGLWRRDSLWGVAWGVDRHIKQVYFFLFFSSSQGCFFLHHAYSFVILKIKSFMSFYLRKRLALGS